MHQFDSPEKRYTLSLDNISKRFGKRDVLTNLSLFVEQGEFLTLLGPSGCGKTTILRLMAGLETPDTGHIFLNGEDITLIPAEQRPIHTIFQRYALFPHMSVFQNVAFGLHMHGVQEPELTHRVMESLKWLQLEEFAHYPPNRLSGGQQQRVAIARAVVNRPKLLLLDECLSALDHKLRRKIKNELKALQRQLNIPFVFVTHNQEEALSISDRIIVLKTGKVEQSGTPKEIYEEPENLFVAKFIGDSNLFSATVLAAIDAQTVLAKIETYQCELAVGAYLRRRPDLVADQLVGRNLTVLLRPEDLRITDLQPSQPGEGLIGYVKEQNYKGMTLDSVIELESGQVVLASEFFNEDDPEVEHALHQRVCVSWVQSWEVIVDA